MSERNYKKEYRDYRSKPEQKKNRAKRNAARKTMGLVVGDPREGEQQKQFESGFTNLSSNRKKGAKM